MRLAMHAQLVAVETTNIIQYFKYLPLQSIFSRLTGKLTTRAVGKPNGVGVSNDGAWLDVKEEENAFKNRK